jgi:hypothetical protein
MQASFVSDRMNVERFCGGRAKGNFRCYYNVNIVLTNYVFVHVVLQLIL